MSTRFFKYILKKLFLDRLILENKLKVLMNGLQILTLDKIVKSFSLKQ